MKLDYEPNADRVSRRPSLALPLAGLVVFGCLTTVLVVFSAHAYAGEAAEPTVWAAVLALTSALGFGACFAWLGARLRPPG